MADHAASDTHAGLLPKSSRQAYDVWIPSSLRLSLILRPVQLIHSVTGTGCARGENGDPGWGDVDPDQGTGRAR